MVHEHVESAWTLNDSVPLSPVTSVEPCPEVAMSLGRLVARPAPVLVTMKLSALPEESLPEYVHWTTKSPDAGTLKDLVTAVPEPVKVATVDPVGGGGGDLVTVWVGPATGMVSVTVGPGAACAGVLECEVQAAAPRATATIAKPPSAVLVVVFILGVTR
jgi:hypothetical protein